MDTGRQEGSEAHMASVDARSTWYYLAGAAGAAIAAFAPPCQ